SSAATALNVQGTVAISMAGGSKPNRASGVKLDANQTFKIGTTTLTIGEAKADEDGTKITLSLPRSLLTTIREIRMVDTKNAPIEVHRTGSGYFNEKAELELSAKTKDKVASIEFEIWQNLRVVKAPFNVTANLGIAAGGRAAGSSDGASPAETPKS